MRALLAIVVMACVVAPATTFADPVVPHAHHGKSRVLVRWSSAGTAFSTTTYGSATSAASTERETILRAVGVYGVRPNWGISYDLRLGTLSKSKHGSTKSASGLEDQIVSIERALHQSGRFADALALGFVVPTGSTASTPPLGAGAAAFQPGYEMQFGSDRGYASLGVAARLYGGGFGGQWRATGELGTRFRRTLGVAGTLSYYRSMNALASGPSGYDELRAGFELRGTGSHAANPLVRVERSIAGRNIHASTRISVGVNVKY